MYLPFDQNNPKVKAVVSALTVALVIVALVIVFKTVGFSRGGKINVDYQYSMGYVLADAIGKAVGSGKIVIINFQPPAGANVKSPVTQAQKDGIKAAFKKHKGVTISDEVGLSIMEPMMMEFIRPGDLESIITNHPDAKGFLSMVGLPKGGPGLIPSLRPDDHPIIVAYDPSGFEIEAWIGSERAAAIAVLNYQNTEVSGAPTAKEAKKFNERFILVTQENLDKLGNLSPPGRMPGPAG